MTTPTYNTGYADGTASRLVVREGEMVLEGASGVRHVPAIDVFRVAVRGDSEIAGIPVVIDSPDVIFHPQPAEVGLLLREDGDRAVAAACVRHGDQWVETVLSGDHALVGIHWYPLDVDTASAVRDALASLGSEPLTAERYLGLYGGLSRPFQIIDELGDSAVAHLSGGTATAKGVTARLYPYQADGLRWLSARATAGLGGILADEMGLGKTLQIIALAVQRLGGAIAVGPFLVVVPATLVENWSREFAKFAPTVRVYRHVGPRRTRRPTEITRAQVVLTTYETAVADQAVLEMVEWDTVVVDEAQAIKNPDALRSRAVRRFPRRAAFAVTGTPLENRTLDTWTLSDFALPGYLGSRSNFGSVLESEPALLKSALRPLVLRREVADVVTDLPSKIESDVALEMFDAEAAGYDSVRDLVRGSRSNVPLLALLTKLRMYTAHPDCVLGPGPRPEARSAKLARLLEVLEELQASGSKSLVFIAFTQAADIVADAIQRRLGSPAWTLDGRLPVAERQPLIDHFSEYPGPATLVLNPVAGGVGLNIQAAAHVVHYTLEWNPAKEAQATARSWRRGQQLPVLVQRLFYGASIDEVILERLEQKRALFGEVIAPTDPESDTDIRGLLDRALELPSIDRGHAPDDFEGVGE